MTLSDTAEYWHDIKGGSNKKKHIFTHIPGYDCGHYHVIEGVSEEEIDCHVCKNAFKQNPEVMTDLMNAESLRRYSAAKKREKRKMQKMRKRAKHGICDCGHPFVIRTNKKTGSQFLGCNNYPFCTKTKNIN